MGGRNSCVMHERTNRETTQISRKCQVGSRGTRGKRREARERERERERESKKSRPNVGFSLLPFEVERP